MEEKLKTIELQLSLFFMFIFCKLQQEATIIEKIAFVCLSVQTLENGNISCDTDIHAVCDAHKEQKSKYIQYQVLFFIGFRNIKFLEN